LRDHLGATAVNGSEKEVRLHENQSTSNRRARHAIIQGGPVKRLIENFCVPLQKIVRLRNDVRGWEKTYRLGS